MKTQIETLEYTLPAYWASYLINGDASGLKDGEQAAIDAFISKESKPRPIYFVDVGESYFARSNDANSLGGDVADYVAHIL